MPFRFLAAVVAALFAVIGAITAPAAAQGWPTRPVTMVYPFAPGGFGDVLARVLAPRLTDLLGQPVIVENVAGAGGMVGSARVAKAAPDGYQFVLGTAGTHAANQSLYKQPLYDAATDFAPVTLLVEQPMVLAARNDFPAETLPDFIAYAKANQGKLQYGSSGTGSATHLACVLLHAAIGANVVHVPYRSAGLSLQDMMTGRIDYQCQILPAALPLIEANRIKGIATLAKSRSRALPNLPTAHEQGLTDFETVGWYALFLPKNTPAPIVQKLRDATVAALDLPAVQERLKDIGADPIALGRRSPEYLQGHVEREIVKWGVPIKASGVRMD